MKIGAQASSTGRLSRTSDFDRIVKLTVEWYHPERIYQWGSLLDPRTFAEWRAGTSGI